jgi:predicted transcriptional regulator
MKGALSETNVAKKWIAQFDETDKDTAKLILDSLFFVSNEELISGLNQILQKYIANHHQEYIALFAVKDVMAGNYWEVNREQLKLKKIGSEAIISYFCRCISETNNFLLNHPDKETMRSKKCKHIIIINDIIGSGTQTNDFCNWLYNDSTIRSWVSLNYAYINVCSYAGTKIGHDNLKKNKIISELLIAQYIEGGRSLWSSEDRQKIIGVCKKYSVYTSRKNKPLGFKEAFTFICFNHKCPNTSPSIIWAPNTIKWKSMFPKRPDLILDKHFFSIGFDIKMVLDYLNLTKSILLTSFNEETKIMVVILNFFSRKRYSNRNISEILSMPITEVNEYVEKLFTMNLLDRNFKVTKMGKSLIRSAKKVKIIRNELDLKDGFYYPQQLRGPIGSSS